MTDRPEAEIVTLYGQCCDPRVSSKRVVAMLEDALERARAGEITGIAMALINYDKSSGYITAGMTNSVTLLGSVYRLLGFLSKED